VFSRLAADTSSQSEYASFPMPASPTSPTDTSDYSSYEATSLNFGGCIAIGLRWVIVTHSPLNAAGSLFSNETRNASPITSPGHSQIIAEVSKPPVSEAPSRTVSNGNDSATIVTDSEDDQADSGHAQERRRVAGPLPWGPGPFQHVHDGDQHDPTIHDTPSPHERKPRLPRINTNPPLESRNSDTVSSTPGPSGEAGGGQLFNSAIGIQVAYSRSGSGSQDVPGPAHRVVGVHQLAGKRVKSKHPFPIQPLELPRRKQSTNVESRHGLRIPLAPPSQNARGNSNLREPERPRNSTLSWSSSPFNEFQIGADLSERIPEAKPSSILGRESGSQRRTKVPGRDQGSDIGSSKETVFPRRKGKRIVPKWDGGEGMSEERYEEMEMEKGEEDEDEEDEDEGEGEKEDEGKGEKEKEKEKGNSSRLSIDYVSVPSEADDQPRDQNLAPVGSTQPEVGYTTQDAIVTVIRRSSPNPSIAAQLLTKLGVRKTSQLLRRSKTVLIPVQKNTPAPPINTTTTGSTSTSTADSVGRGRERTSSGLSSLMGRSVRAKKKRNLKASIMNVLGE
jgi:hypothetical protein